MCFLEDMRLFFTNKLDFGLKYLDVFFGKSTFAPNFQMNWNEYIETADTCIQHIF